MSSFAPHKPETFSGLQLEQSLDFQLRLGGAGKRNPHVNDGLPLRAFPLERGLDEHEARTPQNSIDQKEVVEPVRVYRGNPPPFHSNVLPALFGAKCAREIVEHTTCCPSSKFDSAPHYYGLALFHIGNFATGGRVA